MFQLYSICMSVSGYVGQEVHLTGSASENDGTKTQLHDIKITLPEITQAEDFRDWLRQALAAAVEAL